jgi:hypothetical protein
MVVRRSARYLGLGTPIEMEVRNIIRPWSNIIFIMTRRNPCVKTISFLMMRSIMDVDLGNSSCYILSLIVLNWLCEGRDSGSSLLRYINYSLTALIFVVNLFFPFISLEMAPRGRNLSRPHTTQPSYATKVVIDATEFYEEFVPKEDKTRMTELEDEVHQIREFHDDEDVEAQVGSFIPVLDN